jgi:hypothetical protein
LAQHPNDISRDLQDLVGSLLVDEDDRPCPDQIVSHSYFKMSTIPDRLSSTLTSVAPTWTPPRPPTADTIRRGYSETWFKLCQECGVGEFAPGRFFAVAGSLSNSIARDIEKEIKAGRAPMIPMSSATVYLPYIPEKKVKSNLSHISEETSGSSLHQQTRLREITGNGRAVARQYRTVKEAPAAVPKENVPPPSAKIPDRVEATEKPERPETGLRRARSARIRPTPTTVVEAPAPKTVKTARSMAQIPRLIASSNSAEIAEALPKAALQRSGTTSRINPRIRTASREQDIQQMAEKPFQQSSSSRPSSRDENLERPSHAPPVRGTRSRTASREDTTAKPTVTRALTGTRGSTLRQRTEANAQHASFEVKEFNPEPRVMPSKVTRSALPSELQQTARQALPVDQIAREAAPEASSFGIRNSDPATILAMARRLRSNLLASLSGQTVTGRGKETAPSLPFVTKWVDYAKKHGIGYVLSNGTVGAIFNACKENPTRHVVVRDGHTHLRKISVDKGLVVSQLPLEVYTMGSNDFIRHLPGTSSQRRTNGLLWAKFARYMCASLSGNDGTATEDYGETEALIVRYYQRLGNVGVWGFSNGCYQVS